MNPLKVRMRPDLVLASHGGQSQRYWVVHDPVTLKFFRLRDEECSILRMLDGHSTLAREERRRNRNRSGLFAAGRHPTRVDIDHRHRGRGRSADDSHVVVNRPPRAFDPSFALARTIRRHDDVHLDQVAALDAKRKTIVELTYRRARTRRRMDGD